MRLARTEAARRLGLAILSGVLGTLAFPTFDWWVLAYLAPVPLYVAIDGEPAWRAAWWGFASGLAFSLGTLYWVTVTMTRYGGMGWPVAALTLVALAVYLGCFPAAFAYAMRSVRVASPVLYVLYGAALWVALELLRTHLLTGFPWAAMGYSQVGNLWIVQVAAVTGVYGLSFLVLVVGGALAAPLVLDIRSPAGLGPLSLAGLLILAALGYSGWALSRPAEGEAFPVAAVQGNIEQSLKWDAAMRSRTIEVYRRLTLEAAKGRPALIVWPESAAPFFLRLERELGAGVLAVAREAGTPLLVGSPDAEDEPRRFFNAAFLITARGEIVEKYDKIHLVPFGEYVPLRPVLFFVRRLAHGIGDFSPGSRSTIFTLPRGRFAVTICYEVIFPDQVRHYVRSGAEFLVNITNDAWFGRTAAPYQHLAMAAMRAVENGVYLVRAANTGISAIVAPTGEILQASDLFVEAVVQGRIRLRGRETLYTRYGEVFAWTCVAFAAAVLVGFRRRPLS